MSLFAHGVNEDPDYEAYTHVGYGQGGDLTGNRGDVPGYDLEKFYRDAQKKKYYDANDVDPYFQKQLNEYRQRAGQDRSQLTDLYGALQKQAQGAETPQQAQMKAGYMNAALGSQNLANNARGGAYAQSAARSAVTQNTGVQGAVNQQALGVQKNQDMMSAQDRMQQVSAALRAQDQQAMGLESQEAMSRANQLSRGRGLDIQGKLGYAGLEQGAIGSNTGEYMGDIKRNNMIAEQNRQRERDTLGTIGASAGIALSFLGIFSDKGTKEPVSLYKELKQAVKAGQFMRAKMIREQIRNSK